MTGNVIPMPEPEKELDRKLIRVQARLLADMLANCAVDALSRIQQAECEGLRRLEEYTPQDRLLNLKEAAAYLGFKPRTLRDWCSGLHPILQHSLIGGELRFRKAWLDAAVERRSVGPKKIKL